MKEQGTEQERISIAYFEGVNSSVQQVIASRNELSHVENARSTLIGVLEKREGQSVVGHDRSGETFFATGNYGLVYFEDGGSANVGPIRISSIDGQSAGIYYLDSSEHWIQISNDVAENLSLAKCDFANIDGNLMIVNGTDTNKMIVGEISENNTQVIDSTTDGSLYNSPRAHKVAFYKGRIYLADYYDVGGNRLKTSVIRSSYPLGIVSLLSDDVDSVNSMSEWVFPVTDTKYFYSAARMNKYEIYRWNNKIATIFINDAGETSITASSGGVTFEPGYSSFLSSDEIWVGDTFTGTKQYRWVSNSSTTGKDVKQYDTFKLVGGDEDAITLMEPIGNTLMIANKNAIMTWNDFTLENFDIGIGSCSPNGYVKLKGALYFLHYSGVYSTSGGVPQLISRKIERYIRGATKAGLENAAAGSKGLSVFFTIGDSTLYNNDGSVLKTLSDVCLEFNVADENWFIHTNVTANQFETYLSSSGSEKLLSTSVTSAKDQVLGEEMVVNGGFTDDASGWTLDDGWSHNSGSVTFVDP